MSAPPVYQVLDRLLSLEIPVREFEQWIYDSPELEQILGAEEYLELLAFNYGQPDAAYELRKKVASIYESHRPGRLILDRVWRLSCGLIIGVVPLPRAVHQLAGLWYDGHEWIPNEFVGISSELDDIPPPEQYPLWNSRALEAKRSGWESRTNVLAEAAVRAARQLLQTKYPDAPCA